MRKKIKVKELELLFQRRSLRLGWGVALASITMDYGIETAVDVLGLFYPEPLPVLRGKLRNLLLSLCNMAPGEVEA
jgi:hypothetical protein